MARQIRPGAELPRWYRKPMCQYRHRQLLLLTTKPVARLHGGVALVLLLAALMAYVALKARLKLGLAQTVSIGEMS